VRNQYRLRTLRNKVLNGGKRGSYAGVVGNGSGFVLRHIKIDTGKNALTLYFYIFNGFFVHRLQPYNGKSATEERFRPLVVRRFGSLCG